MELIPTNAAQYSLSPFSSEFHTITMAIHGEIPIMIRPIAYSGLLPSIKMAKINIRLGAIIQFKRNYRLELYQSVVLLFFTIFYSTMQLFCEVFLFPCPFPPIPPLPLPV